MTTQHYTAHGLIIQSDYPLAMVPSQPLAQPDLVVRRSSGRPVPEEDPVGSEQLALLRAPDGTTFYSMTADPDGVTMRYPALCLMRADPAVRTVTVHLHPGADEGLIPVLVAGAVVTLHLMLRRRLALHASAVELHGQAIALVGMSGMGKSTLATLLALAGHPLITDDLLHVDVPSDGPVTVHRGGLESRLRESAFELAEAGRARLTADGRMAVDLPMTDELVLPLRACVVPQPSRTAERVALRRLTPSAGMAMLLHFPRLAGWCQPRGLAEQFALTGDVAAAVPVVLAELPWGPPFDPGMAGQLVAALDELDLTP
jgi:hypothetical protein